MPMNESRAHARIESLLAAAGLHIDGPGPDDIRVHDERLYSRVLAHGSLGLGESYMDGWWDADDLDGFLSRLLDAHLDERVGGAEDAWLFLKSRMVNLQRGRRAYEVGEQHYDLGNDLFEAMLGKRLVYSCGYWDKATDLDAAQEAKLDLVFRKLGLQPGMRVLDIGCGWGEALKLAAERHGVSGVGVTVSREQAEYARRICRGLPVEIRLTDYREIQESFDRVFSIGMFEHVGVKNYRTYFQVARRCTAEDGLFLLHTIGSNVSSNHTDPWIEKYIFPNSMIPSAEQIAEASERLFVIEDWHNFGADYDRTLMAWRANFDPPPGRVCRPGTPNASGACGGSICPPRRRCSARAATSSRQLVMSPRGVRGGYRAPR
jgi:cyclopropane-fatty-acyl-phospholipid synthase